MRVALAQINPTVGDIAANSSRILDFVGRAKKQGAELVVFPELSVIGYPPKDLLLKPQFIDDNLRAVRLIASQVHGIDVVVGYAERSMQQVGRPLHNAVALLRNGEVASRHFKTLLPTYDVFDESRYFEPGPADEQANVAEVGGHAVGFSICEDLWNDEKMIARRLYHQNPILKLREAGAEIMVNTSASPFVAGKHAFRIELFASQVRQVGRPLIYVNQVGGNDELVFDGNSLVFDASGAVMAQGKAFEEDLLVVDCGEGAVRDGGPFPSPGTPGEGQGGGEIRRRPLMPPPRPSPGVPGEGEIPRGEMGALRDIYHALVLGLRDYVHKCGFKSVVLGLSGGIDSALTAAIAVAAFGPDRVVGIAMPSRFSSDHSVNDARELAKNLGIRFQVVPIGSVHDAYEELLAPAFAGNLRDVTEENLQARVRGAILMAFSNKFNHLLLTTGNKSELAVGYCTLYGDMCGGLAVISDVPKTTVYALSEYMNEQAGRDLIPRNSITKPPSAELRPNQLDQDSLPSYDVLDGILHRYVEEEKGAAEIIAEGFDPATVVRIITLIDRSEYKRRQSAPGIKVTSRAFGFGRRMPIAQNYRQAVPGRES
jgi:NAD+ synthetase